MGAMAYAEVDALLVVVPVGSKRPRLAGSRPRRARRGRRLVGRLLFRRGVTGAVLDGPGKGVVGDLLPALLPQGVMRAAGKLAIFGDRLRVAVVLEVRPVG